MIVQGHKIRTLGKGKQPVVLVHGFGNSSLMWLPFAWPFRDRFTFYIPDLPGFGGNRAGMPPPGAGVLPFYAGFIQEVIEKTGSDSVYLVGFSLGALSSLQLQALGGFSKVSRYLHVDHSPCPKRLPGWDGGIHADLWRRFEAIVERVRREPATAHQPLEKLPADLAESYIELLEVLGERSISQPALRAFNRFLHRAPMVKKFVAGRASWPWAYAVIQTYLHGDYDFRPTLGQGNAKTTVLYGARSELFGPSAVGAMRDAMPGAQFTAFEKSGHDLIFNEPLRFAEALRRFLE